MVIVSVTNVCWLARRQVGCILVSMAFASYVLVISQSENVDDSLVVDRQGSQALATSKNIASRILELENSSES